MPVTQAEYKKLLERERARGAGPQTGRDDAVRRANIAAGFGNSTAERFLGGPFKLAPKGGGGGGRKSGKGGGGRSAGGGSVPTPKPRPDDAPSPVRDPSLMWPGATSSPPRDFPPDLAVSPPHERWPGATSYTAGVQTVPQPAIPPTAATGVTQPSPIPPIAATGVTQPSPLFDVAGGRGDRPGAFPATPGFGTPGYGLGGDKLLRVPSAWPSLFDFLRPPGLHG